MRKPWSKRLGKIAAPVLCAVMLASPLAAIPAAAVTGVTAVIRPDMTIIIDGQKRNFYNVNARQVHPLYYAGSTYLPVRAIGELMGKNVDWNEATKTVTLAGRRGTPPVSGTPDGASQRQDVDATVRDDFTVIVDGAVRSFANANGRRVYPLLYRGSTYLPVRAIGELMGKEVGWNQATQTVTLSGKTVTDADTFGLITLAQAKEKALAHAGLSASQVTFTKQVLDREDGRMVYEIEFFTTSQNRWYEYEIDGTTGAVVSWESDGSTAPPSGGLITAEQAKAKALAHAGLSADQVTFTKTELELDDGWLVYEIEFYTPNYLGYEYEIGALDGEIWRFDLDHTSHVPPIPSGVISIDEAKEKALVHAGLSASQVNFTKQKLEWEDGEQVYEIEFFTKDLVEYKYEIHAFTGKVLSFEQDGSHGGPSGPSTGLISQARAQEIALSLVPGATVGHIIEMELDEDDGRYIYQLEIEYGHMEYEIEIDAVTGAVLEFKAED